jgi:hypothetical protein
VAPVVLTMRVEVPDPVVSVAGLNEHVGGAEVALLPLSVMLLHDSLTLAPKLPFEVNVIVEVAEPPAETAAGESAAADMVDPATFS